MKKIAYYVLLCFAISCTAEDVTINESSRTRSLEETVTILKERDSKYPLEFPKRIKARSAVEPLSENNNYLGYSYDLENFPLGTSLNIGSPIIDVDKLKAQEDFYIKDIGANVQDMKSFSYSTFDRYTYNSKDTEKVTTGLDLNFGIFSFGNKNTIETIYTKNIANESKRVFGELDVNVWARKYYIKMSSHLKKKIIQKYLNKTFIEEIHSITSREFIETYGPFVLVDYYTGGRLMALYSGVYEGNDATDIKEKNITIDIRATYGTPKDTAGGNASIGIGRNYYKEEMTSKKISNMAVSIRAVGGNLNYASFTSPDNIANVNIDLSKWMTSLTPDTYRMVDIANGGLIPLSDLILEYNLQTHIKRYLYSGDFFSNRINLQEPYIEILRREVQGFRFIVPILWTKYGDGITIDGMFLSDPTSSEAKIQAEIQQLVNEKAKIYGLKIQTSTYVDDINPIIPETVFDLGIMDYSERLFSKYIDKENNTLYLLLNRGHINRSNSSEFSNLSRKIKNSGLKLKAEADTRDYSMKVGWSFYDYNRSLNLYGLTEFVKSLPEITIDPIELQDYRIMGF